MGIAASKKSTMTLYSGFDDLFSHRVRIVLAEKGVAADVIEVVGDRKFEELAEANPYHTVPTLIDRNLTVFDANIITEYLDERFPHPPLLPVYPIARAKARLAIYRIDNDWYPLVADIRSGDQNKADAARKQLLEGLISITPLFKDFPFFLSEEFSLIDCCLAPLLWRIEGLGVELPKPQAKLMEAYAKKIFSRDSFQASLLESEKEIYFYKRDKS